MHHPTPTTGTEAAVPMLRLSGFYFAYYAALGAFTPYWSLYLQSQGMGVAAISVLMSLWYATRIVAPSTWTTLAARSSRPIPTSCSSGRAKNSNCGVRKTGSSVLIQPSVGSLSCLRRCPRFRFRCEHESLHSHNGTAARSG